MVTVDKVREKLDELYSQAHEDMVESIKIAMNSYGAGYDTGYFAAVNEIRKFINGEQDA